VKLEIAELVRGELTYPSRDGNSSSLEARPLPKSKTEVSYEITGGAVRRRVRRNFPRRVTIDQLFMWVLGLLKGEGLKSVGSHSSMYRICVVNNDFSGVIRAVMGVLDSSGLERWENMRSRGGLIRISYGPRGNPSELKKYWADKIGLPEDAIILASHPEPQKRARYGSCMLTINDVLLRRVADLIAEGVWASLFNNDAI
jgi:hypothetical protein